MGEGGDDGGISHLVLQNGGKHCGAVLCCVFAPNISANANGVRCSRTRDDARRLQAAPRFYPSDHLHFHDVEEPCASRIRTARHPCTALLAIKETKIGKATIRVPHIAGAGSFSAMALICPRDHHAL